MGKQYPTPCVRREGSEWVVQFSNFSVTPFTFKEFTEALEYAMQSTAILHYGKLWVPSEENPNRFILHKEWAEAHSE
jgi:hypothetical protein